jgi:hypothetical protein
MSPLSEKKLIVVPDLKDLNDQEFVTNVTAKIQLEIDNPLIVPGLSPTALIMQGKLAAMLAKMNERTILMTQLHEKSTEISLMKKEINDNMVDDWAKQIQTAVAGDLSKVQLLGFHARGDGHDSDTVSVNNSHPLITGIDTNVHLQHTLNIINSVSGKARLPHDALQLAIYEIMSEAEPPDDLRLWRSLGIAKRGKYINHFASDEYGKTVWYMAVYISKATLLPAELAGKVRAIVS